MNTIFSLKSTPIYLTAALLLSHCSDSQEDAFQLRAQALELVIQAGNVPAELYQRKITESEAVSRLNDLADQIAQLRAEYDDINDDEESRKSSESFFAEFVGTDNGRLMLENAEKAFKELSQLSKKAITPQLREALLRLTSH